MCSMGFGRDQVTKIYPDAELPSFDTTKQTDSEMEMVYRSERKMADFARGLIQGAIKHFGEDMTVEMIPESEDGSIVRFKITKQ